MPKNPSDNRVGLYVHIPFCLSRCHYCAFASGIYNGGLADSYIDALAGELALRKTALQNGAPSTLFIGGGTPSCLSPSQLDALLSLLPFPADGGEASCEVNPDSADREKFALLREGGVNRCSLGVQTFSPAGLELLGRRHDARTAVEKVDMAVAAGFASVSLDLITAWPGQEPADLERDLKTAIDCGVDHISCYNLILEEGSPIARRLAARGLVEKDEAEARLFWDMTERVLESAGLDHYETSNFARPGFRCRHNVDTWKGYEYLGIGLAAHSHLGGRRSANSSVMEEYIAKSLAGLSAEAFGERLESEAKARECAVFWLRLSEGIDCGEFAARTGYDIFELYRDVLPALLDSGVMVAAEEGKMLRVGKEYGALLDAILVDLI